MGINVESAQVIQAAAKLGCLVLKCPFYYLGTRVGGSMTRVQAWQEIVEKVKSRLSKWKSKTLSIGGRIGDTSLVRSFRRIPRGGIEQNQFDSLVELVRSVTIVPSAEVN
ncbi:hypothetical protein Tco_0121079 [Tanacetum coccineum]